MSIIRILLLALVLPAAALAQSAVDPGDRFTGSARSAARSGSMVFELLSVEGGAVSAQVRFGGALSGSGRVQGLIRRGTLHLSGVMVADGARHDIALRATARDDGSLAGVYEMSEQVTRERQAGDFTLVGADWNPARASAAR